MFEKMGVINKKIVRGCTGGFMRYRLKIELNGTLLLQMIIAWCSVFFIVKTNTYAETGKLTIISVVLWVLFMYLLRSKYAIQRVLTNGFSLAFILFIIYIFCFSFLEYGVSTTINAILSHFTYFSGIFIFVLYVNYIKPKNYAYTLGGIVCIWLLADLQLLVLCKTIPNIGRLIVSHGADVTISSSIGSPYALAESSCFIVIAIVRLTTSCRYNMKKITKLCMMAIAILMGLTVYETQSTITTLIMLLGVVGSVFLNILEGKKGNSLRKRMIIICIIIMFILLFVVSKEYIGSVLIQSFSSGDSVFAIRLYQVGQALAHNTLSSDFSERIALMLTSFKTFLDNPIVGNMYTGGVVTGGHCGLFDVFSNYGLLGGVPYLLVFIAFFKYLKRKLNNYDFLLWFPLFVMSLLNPIVLYQTYFAVLFIVPSLYYLAGRNIVDNGITCKKKNS